MSWLSRLFGDANARAVKQLAPVVEAINKHEKQFEGLSDDRLREETVALRQHVKEHPGSEEEILDRAFALVREAAKRTLKQRHYDVQLMGGIILHRGNIAEMRTGEGKTLVATLPIYLNALSGNGVHLVTVNDYLAKRDTVWMGQVYHLLGLSVGCIQHEQAFLYEPGAQDTPDDLLRNLKPVARKEAYAADITYGTNNEFGFDYLRDNMVADLTERVQRGHAFAIVDEVDSILIDEARTPLIISAPAEQPAERYYQFAQLVNRLEENADYNVDEKMRAATLTQDGITKLEQWLGIKNIYEAEGIETVHHIEQALKARTLFLRDRDYVVKDGEVIIVDEFTGRLMFGRRFSEGLHQAIEAKENVQIKEESVTMATITFQNYFRMYAKLSGMTGTASTEAEEFAKIYNLDTVTIPTNKPMIRQDFSDRVYKNERGKYAAIVARVRELHDKGQPVLLGTISIEKNELVSDFLKEAGVPHELLNAKNHEREAKIIADAGRKGAVTLATNIAGRGVDIILGGVPYHPHQAEEVRALGGLFVLGTERHEARRIDNQLRGRSGRQGDPGASQFFVSLEDDLLRIFGPNRMRAVMERLGLPDDMPIENSMVSRAIESAQRKVEGHNFDIRKHLVEYDDVINKHREVIYSRRDRVLQHAQSQQRLRELIEPMIEQEIERVVSFHTSSDIGSDWNMEEIYEVVATIFPIDIHDRLKLEEFRLKSGDKLHDANGRESIVQHLAGLARKAYENLEERIKDPALMGLIEKSILLRSIDTLWVEHLDQMEHLRRGIGLRGYGQRDPLVEYKKEAYELFHQLNANVDEQAVYSIFKVGTGPAAQPRPNRLRMVAPNPTVTSFSGLAPSSQQEQGRPAPLQEKLKTAEGKKIGRNDPCPCGAINPNTKKPYKYKQCGLIKSQHHKAT